VSDDKDSTIEENSDNKPFNLYDADMEVIDMKNNNLDYELNINSSMNAKNEQDKYNNFDLYKSNEDEISRKSEAYQDYSQKNNFKDDNTVQRAENSNFQPLAAESNTVPEIKNTHEIKGVI
jgi:hypothetical protein